MAHSRLYTGRFSEGGERSTRLGACQRPPREEGAIGTGQGRLAPGRNGGVESLFGIAACARRPGVSFLLRSKLLRGALPPPPGNAMKFSALTLLALLVAVPGFAREKAPPDPMAPGLSGPDRLSALVERVKLEQRNLKTLEARFTQEQQSSMLTAHE